MTSTTSFRNLEVWQESMTLVEEIYQLSKSFPREELFGLTSQLRKPRYPSLQTSVKGHEGSGGA